GIGSGGMVGGAPGGSVVGPVGGCVGGWPGGVIGGSLGGGRVAPADGRAGVGRPAGSSWLSVTVGPSAGDRCDGSARPAGCGPLPGPEPGLSALEHPSPGEEPLPVGRFEAEPASAPVARTARAWG